MSKQYKFRNFIICDEVREEIGRKHLIIGAYSGAILLPFVPFLSRIFTVRIEVEVHKINFDKVSCKIFKPDKKTIFFGHEMPFHTTYKEFPVALYFYNIWANFDQIGDYAIHLAMDGPFSEIGSFKILTEAELPKVVD